MTVREYNKIYSEVGTCKVVINKLDEILRDGDIARLQSLVPNNFTQIVGEALDMYLIHVKLQINSGTSSVDALEPFLIWCERTGNEFNSINYQEFLDQESIEEIFKDN